MFFLGRFRETFGERVDEISESLAPKVPGTAGTILGRARAATQDASVIDRRVSYGKKMCIWQKRMDQILPNSIHVLFFLYPHHGNLHYCKCLVHNDTVWLTCI